MARQVIEVSGHTAGLQETDGKVWQVFQDVRLRSISIVENWRSRARNAAIPGYSRATINESVPLGWSPGSCAGMLSWLAELTYSSTEPQSLHMCVLMQRQLAQDRRARRTQGP
jgi:hypothetical protein